MNNYFTLIILLIAVLLGTAVFFIYNNFKATSEKEHIFAYGTLNDTTIQLKLYNRKLKGTPDQVKQYYLSSITVNENNILNTYPIAIYSGKQSDVISGMVYEITPQELAATDIYEGAEYKRVQVLLQSGVRAWIYIGGSM